MLTLHNLHTPTEIFSGEQVRREVMGTLIKSISLTRFDELGLPALQIILVGSRPLDAEIQDYQGLLEITLRAGELE